VKLFDRGEESEQTVSIEGLQAGVPKDGEHTNPAAKSSFQNVAPFYDELMRQVPYRMWVSYYQLLLSTIESRPKRVLDVACGTGTMTEMLHREGYQMTGFDLSEPMIEIARRKAAKKKLPVEYHVANAVTFDLGQSFDGILCFFDSLNNITRPDHLQQVFHRVFAQLEPGGSFIFDLNTAFAFRTNMFDQSDLRKQTRLKYDWQGTWDEETRLITVNMKFWRDEESFSETHIQRAYDLDEVLPMLKAAGFHQIQSFHSYGLTPPRKRSDRIHYAAIKPI
jgi:ubiquinone/menaquinone biosynthesis C-methylase UbiE